MTINCCDCKHIMCNSEFDGLLDCELDSEGSNRKQCCEDYYDKFELESDENIRKSYLEELKRQNPTKCNINSFIIEISKQMLGQQSHVGNDYKRYYNEPINH